MVQLVEIQHKNKEREGRKKGKWKRKNKKGKTEERRKTIYTSATAGHGTYPRRSTAAITSLTMEGMFNPDAAPSCACPCSSSSMVACKLLPIGGASRDCLPPKAGGLQSQGMSRAHCAWYRRLHCVHWLCFTREPMLAMHLAHRDRVMTEDSFSMCRRCRAEISVLCFRFLPVDFGVLPPIFGVPLPPLPPGVNAAGAGAAAAAPGRAYKLNGSDGAEGTGVSCGVPACDPAVGVWYCWLCGMRWFIWYASMST